MKDDSIILHPLPRIDEISTDVDKTKNAKCISRQGRIWKAHSCGSVGLDTKRERVLEKSVFHISRDVFNTIH